MGVFMGKKKSLVLYSDSRCPVCDEMKAYLRKQKISFTEIELDSHPDIEREIGIGVVPVICKVNKKGKSKCVIGFNKKKLGELIKKTKK